MPPNQHGFEERPQRSFFERFKNKLAFRGDKSTKQTAKTSAKSSFKIVDLPAKPELKTTKLAHSIEMLLMNNDQKKKLSRIKAPIPHRRSSSLESALKLAKRPDIVTVPLKATSIEKFNNEEAVRVPKNLEMAKSICLNMNASMLSVSSCSSTSSNLANLMHQSLRFGESLTAQPTTQSSKPHECPSTASNSTVSITNDLTKKNYGLDPASTAYNNPIMAVAIISSALQSDPSLLFSPEFVSQATTCLEQFIPTSIMPPISTNSISKLGPTARPLPIPFRVAATADNNAQPDQGLQFPLAQNSNLVNSLQSLFGSNQYLASSSMLNVMQLVGSNSGQNFSGNNFAYLANNGQNYYQNNCQSYQDPNYQPIPMSSNAFSSNQHDLQLYGLKNNDVKWLNSGLPGVNVGQSTDSLTSSGLSLFGHPTSQFARPQISTARSTDYNFVTGQNYQPFLQPQVSSVPQVQIEQQFRQPNPLQAAQNQPFFQKSDSQLDQQSQRSLELSSSFSMPQKVLNAPSSLHSSTMNNLQPAKLEVSLSCSPSTSKTPTSMLSLVEPTESPIPPEPIQSYCKWLNCRCKLAFHSPAALADHVKTIHTDHETENRCYWHACSRNKPFKANYQLDLHMRKHTFYKPHCCKFPNCFKSYSRLENLKTHCRTHNKNDKPFDCPKCMKRFTNASDRAKHLNRTHSDSKPYICPVLYMDLPCNKAYTDPSSLRKHIKTEHGDLTVLHAKKNKETIDKTVQRKKDEKKVVSYGTIFAVHEQQYQEMYGANNFNMLPDSLAANSKANSSKSSEVKSLPQVWRYKEIAYSLVPLHPCQNFAHSQGLQQQQMNEIDGGSLNSYQASGPQMQTGQLFLTNNNYLSSYNFSPSNSFTSNSNFSSPFNYSSESPSQGGVSQPRSQNFSNFNTSTTMFFDDFSHFSSPLSKQLPTSIYGNLIKNDVSGDESTALICPIQVTTLLSDFTSDDVYIREPMLDYSMLDKSMIGNDRDDFLRCLTEDLFDGSDEDKSIHEYDHQAETFRINKLIKDFFAKLHVQSHKFKK